MAEDIRERVLRFGLLGETRSGWGSGRGVVSAGPPCRRAGLVAMATAGEDGDVLTGDLLPFSALSRGNVTTVFFSSLGKLPED